MPDECGTTLPASARLLGTRVELVNWRKEARTGRKIAFFRKDWQGT
jgi:hypothetical protein